jgi:hypothetical protein
MCVILEQMNNNQYLFIQQSSSSCNVWVILEQASDFQLGSWEWLHVCDFEASE